MSAEKADSNLEEMGTLLLGVIKGVFESKSNIEFSEKPSMEKKTLMEYEGKFRIIGMDVFNESTYISFVSLYPSSKAMEDGKACGALVLYIQASTGEGLLKRVGYRKVAEEDEESVLKATGEFFKVIVDEFVKKIKSKGHGGVVATEPESYRNSVPIGIDFSTDQYDKLELGFKIKDVKQMAFDLTMGPIK